MTTASSFHLVTAAKLDARKMGIFRGEQSEENLTSARSEINKRCMSVSGDDNKLCPATRTSQTIPARPSRAGSPVQSDRGRRRSRTLRIRFRLSRMPRCIGAAADYAGLMVASRATFSPGAPCKKCDVRQSTGAAQRRFHHVVPMLHGALGGPPRLVHPRKDNGPGHNQKCGAGNGI